MVGQPASRLRYGPAAGDAGFRLRRYDPRRPRAGGGLRAAREGQRLRFDDEQNAALPVGRVLPTKQTPSLHQGSAVQYDTVTFTRTITLTGFYDLKV